MSSMTKLAEFSYCIATSSICCGDLFLKAENGWICPAHMHTEPTGPYVGLWELEEIQNKF